MAITPWAFFIPQRPLGRGSRHGRSAGIHRRPARRGHARTAVSLAAVFHSPQVVLFSDDVPRAVEFYKRLGFTETFRVPADGEPIHVDLNLDGYTLGIASGASTRDDHGLSPVTRGQRAAIILWTDDTAVAYAKLTADGVRGLAEPYEWLGRLLIAWIADPDGNPIQIVQDL